MLTAAELHDWAEREGLYIPLTPRGTVYLRSLLRTWAGLNGTGIRRAAVTSRHPASEAAVQPVHRFAV
jgi:hypothetical protein